MKCLAAALGLLGVASAKTYFSEDFSEGWEDRWVVSDWKKDSGEAGEWVASAGPFYANEEDKGLQTSEDARFYAISAKFDEFTNDDKDLVLQFGVSHKQKLDCGGGYIKLLRPDVDQAGFNGDAEYAIMFGPDICGATKRVHSIFRHEQTGENLLKSKDVRCETDQLTHIYTLIVKPDNTYQMLTDGEEKSSGSLLDDWEFLLPKEIKDPEVSKPEDWVDEKMIDDPEDVKPADYDDIPERIADPEAEKPGDWDDEADGEWEAPEIPNPDFKGPWRPKRIDNPEYKGAWEHPVIANPDFVDHQDVYKRGAMGAIGIELWQVKAGTIFDNIFVSDSVEEAEKYRTENWSEESQAAEKEMFDAQEEERKAKEKAERDADREAREKEAEAAKEAADAEEDDAESLDSEDETSEKDEL